MVYADEPLQPHGTARTTAVLLVNLGTPAAPTAAALRPYLREFLSDPRVVEIPRLVWWPILHGIILRLRPAKSAAKYASIWTAEGSPLLVWSQRQAALLGEELQRRGHRVEVRCAMRYGEPSVPRMLDELKRLNATRVLVVPMYPQYAAATTASVGDAVMTWAQRARRVPELRFVGEYHDDVGYIDALAERVRRHWQTQPRGERLVLSFHGVPERSLQLGDPYHCQCYKTARLLAAALDLPRDRVLVTFQSRFGKAKWLEPYTEPTLVALAQQGLKAVDVMCPGFLTDCLETLEEIDQEARQAFLQAGGTRFEYIPCLNDSAEWAAGLTTLVEQHLQGWDTKSAPDAEALLQQAQAARALGAER